MKVNDHGLKFKVYIFRDMDETAYKLFLEQIMCKFPPTWFLNYEALLVDNKEVCLGVNADKIMFMSCKQNAGWNLNVKIDKKFFQSSEKISYLGTILTNQNFIHEEIRAGWTWGMYRIILSRIFCLPVCCQRIQRLKYTEL